MHHIKAYAQYQSFLPVIRAKQYGHQSKEQKMSLLIEWRFRDNDHTYFEQWHNYLMHGECFLLPALSTAAIFSLLAFQLSPWLHFRVPRLLSDYPYTTQYVPQYSVVEQKTLHR